MAQEVFVDTGFWIALFHRQDEHHSEAETIWQEIKRGRQLPIVTTNWALYETLTWLNCRRNRHDLAIQALDFVSKLSNIVRIEPAQLESRTLEIFRNHPDKGWSVVDCGNFACIEQRHTEYALAYDRNFEQAQMEFGFRLLKP